MNRMTADSMLSMIDEQTLAQVVGFHGHLCPGLSMGIQAAALALREVGAYSHDAEIVAVVETDMCAIDGIQFLTGCTFGKGNLIVHDWGKSAYTFFRRSDGYAVRIVAIPGVYRIDPNHLELFAKIRSDAASDEDKQEFLEIQGKRSHRILTTPPERLFTVSRVTGAPPLRRRMYSWGPCDDCGEDVLETKVRLMNDRRLCVPCFEIRTNT